MPTTSDADAFFAATLPAGLRHQMIASNPALGNQVKDLEHDAMQQNFNSWNAPIQHGAGLFGDGKMLGSVLNGIGGAAIAAGTASMPIASPLLKAFQGIGGAVGNSLMAPRPQMPQQQQRPQIPQMNPMLMQMLMQRSMLMNLLNRRTGLNPMNPGIVRPL